jgi:hypothetical protein
VGQTWHLPWPANIYLRYFCYHLSYEAFFEVGKMKNLFKENPNFQSLSQCIKDETAKLTIQLEQGKNHLTITPKADDSKEKGVGSEQEKAKREKAANIIQRIWRGHKVREAIVNSPYSSYLSLIDPADEQRLLSSIMFGRHEAELRVSSKDRVKNPFIYSGAGYHRVDERVGFIFDCLGKNLAKKFNVKSDGYYYIPVSILKSVPIEKILKLDFLGKIIQKEGDPIALVGIPKRFDSIEIMQTLKASGVKPTLWEIAESVKNLDLLDYSKYKKNISLDPNLPASKEQLLKSEILSRLRVAAFNHKKYPTKKLAVCLHKLLLDLPNSLSAEAIQRIALMVDMAITFYGHNYPRYTFCVYAIIHEISLALSVKKDDSFLQASFDSFLAESKSTFCKALNLEENHLTQSNFIASPALSGTNAFMIAMRIARQMQTETGRTPKIKLVEPCIYYEFENVVSSTHCKDKEPDVFVFSTGPIVNVDGLAPGVDINRFVKREIIDKKRTKPTALILDASTTLYKNIRLNDEVKELVAKGLLSILIIESHQKFGLLHTDQAQHGRLFGLCSEKSFSKNFIQEMQNYARTDFNEHMDMRVGAFISSHCSETLEEIKQQHFTNGAILRNILTQVNLADRYVVKHQDMLENLDELYFLTANLRVGARLRKAIKGIIEVRNSFGHYATTLSSVGLESRISANATDEIDCLIQAAQIYLAKFYKREQLLGMMLENAKAQEPLSMEDQIVALAMINNILLLQKKKSKHLEKKPLELYCALNNVLKQCTLLEGRVNFAEAYSYLHDLHKRIKIEQNPSFLEAINILYNNEIRINPFLVENLKTNPKLTQVIKLLKEINIEKGLVYSLINRPTELTRFLECGELQSCLSLVKNLQSANVKIDLDFMLELLSAKSKDSRVVLNHLLARQFPLTERNVRALIKPPLAQFVINKKDSLTQDKIIALTALAEVYDSYDVFLPLLNNEAFCEAIVFLSNSNADILYNLKKAPEKHKKAKEHSHAFLKNCFDALTVFYDKKDAKPDDKKTLMSALTQAKDDYCQRALGEDRSIFSKMARLSLMGIVNFFAGLTFGLAHFWHYKITNRVGFFTQTNSQIKLEEKYNKLDRMVTTCPAK